MEFKIALIGEAGVGKTALLKRHMTGEFTTRYVTDNRATFQLPFNTTVGRVVFDVTTLRPEDLTTEFDAVIAMFDLTSSKSYLDLSTFLMKNKAEVPLIIVGNKCDVKDRKVSARHIAIHRRLNCPYYDISSKSNYNFEKPFLHLARILTKTPDLCLMEEEYFPLSHPKSCEDKEYHPCGECHDCKEYQICENENHDQGGGKKEEDPDPSWKCFCDGENCCKKEESEEECEDSSDEERETIPVGMMNLLRGILGKMKEGKEKKLFKKLLIEMEKKEEPLPEEVD